jgi:hypothetical protein
MKEKYSQQADYSVVDYGWEGISGSGPRQRGKRSRKLPQARPARLPHILPERLENSKPE